MTRRSRKTFAYFIVASDRILIVDIILCKCMKSQAPIISHIALHSRMALCYKSQKRGHNNARRAESDIGTYYNNIQYIILYAYIATERKLFRWFPTSLVLVCRYLYILSRFAIIHSVYA